MLALLACAATAPPPAEKLAGDSAPPAAHTAPEDTGDPAATDTAPEDTPKDTAPDDTDPDTGTPDDTDPPAPAVRFVALGDAGEGNADQYAVASVIATVCATQGCDFALYLGDNFYDDGVDGVDDSQWQEKFELPYAALSFPFYAVLGNHDNGGDGIGWETWKGDYQVDYTDHSSKWTMPERFYRQDHGAVSFWGLDTNTIFFGFGEEQQDWLTSELDGSSAEWKIVFGHHPYRSNGQHGNAGAYEGFEILPIANGAYFKDFFDAAVCNRADVYICGHDHLREMVEAQCDVELIVSGAGAKTTDIVDRGNSMWFESEVEGFVWVEIVENEMKVQFWDMNGTMDYERVVVK